MVKREKMLVCLAAASHSDKVCRIDCFAVLFCIFSTYLTLVGPGAASVLDCTLAWSSPVTAWFSCCDQTKPAFEKTRLFPISLSSASAADHLSAPAWTPPRSYISSWLAVIWWCLVIGGLLTYLHPPITSSWWWLSGYVLRAPLTRPPSFLLCGNVDMWWLFGPQLLDALNALITQHTLFLLLFIKNSFK